MPGGEALGSELSSDDNLAESEKPVAITFAEWQDEISCFPVRGATTLMFGNTFWQQHAKQASAFAHIHFS